MDKSEIIVWEKWRDPFGYDDIEEKFQSDDPSENSNNYDQEHKEDEENFTLKNIRDQFLLTPLGLIPLTENTMSSKIFNFWTGHTTFSISKNIASIIERVNGVETLDVFTRYRFRISVGKAFKDSIVLREINDSLHEYMNS